MELTLNTTGFYPGSIVNSEIYRKVEELYNISRDNIIVYYMDKCLHYDKQLIEEPISVFINIKLAICLPFDAEDENYQEYYDIAKYYNIPIFESIEIKDENGATIRTIKSIRHDTTVEYIKRVVAVSLKTNMDFFYLYHNNKKLKNIQFIADLCLDNGFFNPSIIFSVKNNTSLWTESQIKFVNLEFLSSRTSIDIFQKHIYNIKRLKEYIFDNYKIPIKHQTLIYKGKVIEDDKNEQTLNDLCIKEGSEINTESLTISITIKPFYIVVEFISDYVTIPGDGRMQFSGMATIKEIKERLVEITGVSQKTLVLMSLLESPYTGSFILENDAVLNQVLSYERDNKALLIKLLRSIQVEISGKEAFSWYISDRDESIKETKKRLEINKRCGKLVFVPPIMEKRKLKTKTRLLDIVDEEITLVFDKQRDKSCVLL